MEKINKVYMIMKKDGTIFEPVYSTRVQAKKMRYNLSMPDPKTTFIKALVIAKNETH